MKKQMYVVMVGTGSYDSYSACTLVVSDDELKANEYAQKMNELAQSLEAKLNVLRKLHMTWMSENPNPHTNVKNLKPIVKWQSEKVITQQMRDERAVIIEHNEAIMKQVRKEYSIWNEKWIQVENEWVSKNLNEQERELRVGFDDNSYWVEVTPMI